MIDFDEEEQVSRMKGGNSWEGGGKVSLRGGRGGCQQALEGWVGGGWVDANLVRQLSSNMRRP